jgi:transcriptional regulator with PAS, ATPase and Fis domain
VITATNRNLQKLVRDGKFRDDLYFRIDIVKLSLPPLSERKEDIPLLLDHFIDQFNHLSGKKIVGISRKAVAALMLHDWPGNVRELENAIEHAFVLCLEGIIRLHHLPARVVPQSGMPLGTMGLSLREAEKRTIFQALERNQWKKMATARELDIDKNTLRRKIKRLGIVDLHS